jgi:anti-anti-sigma factor
LVEEQMMMLGRGETETPTAPDPTPPPARFSFAVSRDRSGVRVALSGELDQSHVERLTPVLRDLIDDQGNGTVVVDLRDVSGVDPEALELFSTASGWARRHGTSLRLEGPPEGLEVRLPQRRTT